MPTIITDTHITTAIAQSNPAARHRDDLLKMELLHLCDVLGVERVERLVANIKPASLFPLGQLLLHLCDVLGVERVERLVANIKRTQQMPHLSPGTSGDPRR